jgi:hypothetical protein
MMLMFGIGLLKVYKMMKYVHSPKVLGRQA